MNGTVLAPALEARDVNFSYRGPVVRNLTLALNPGSVTGIIGPNGSGKTTVLRLLSGILKPASGSILLEGVTPLASLSSRCTACTPKFGSQDSRVGTDGLSSTKARTSEQRSPPGSLWTLSPDGLSTAIHPLPAARTGIEIWPCAMVVIIGRQLITRNYSGI